MTRDTRHRKHLRLGEKGRSSDSGNAAAGGTVAPTPSGCRRTRRRRWNPGNPRHPPRRARPAGRSLWSRPWEPFPPVPAAAMLGADSRALGPPKGVTALCLFTPWRRSLSSQFALGGRDPVPPSPGQAPSRAPFFFCRDCDCCVLSQGLHTLQSSKATETNTQIETQNAPAQPRAAAPDRLHTKRSEPPFTSLGG